MNAKTKIPMGSFDYIYKKDIKKILEELKKCQHSYMNYDEYIMSTILKSKSKELYDVILNSEFSDHLRQSIFTKFLSRLSLYKFVMTNYQHIIRKCINEAIDSLFQNCKDLIIFDLFMSWLREIDHKIDLSYYVVILAKYNKTKLVKHIIENYDNYDLNIHKTFEYSENDMNLYTCACLNQNIKLIKYLTSLKNTHGFVKISSMQLLLLCFDTKIIENALRREHELKIDINEYYEYLIVNDRHSTLKYIIFDMPKRYISRKLTCKNMRKCLIILRNYDGSEFTLITRLLRKYHNLNVGFFKSREVINYMLDRGYPIEEKLDITSYYKYPEIIYKIHTNYYKITSDKLLYICNRVLDDEQNYDELALNTYLILDPKIELNNYCALWINKLKGLIMIYRQIHFKILDLKYCRPRAVKQILTYGIDIMNNPIVDYHNKKVAWKSFFAKIVRIG